MPEKIVFIQRDFDSDKNKNIAKLSIWEHGKGLQTEKSTVIKNLKDTENAIEFFGAEHIVDGHHWVLFLDQYCLRIIDLNNLSNQFKLDNIRKYKWIPKKSKKPWPDAKNSLTDTFQIKTR